MLTKVQNGKWVFEILCLLIISCLLWSTTIDYSKLPMEYRYEIKIKIKNQLVRHYEMRQGRWNKSRNHETGPRFNIKMSSYQYKKSHCGDKTFVRSSYLHNGISYTGKMSSLYWIRALMYNFPVAFKFDRQFGSTATTCQISKRREHLRVDVLYWNTGCCVCLNPDKKSEKSK